METKDTLNFTDLLDELDCGQASVEASRAMREVIARNAEIAAETGKATGELNIKLTFATAGQSGQTDVGYQISGKPALRPSQKTTLYATTKGTLSSVDPRQRKFNFREAPGKAAVRSEGGAE